MQEVKAAMARKLAIIRRTFLMVSNAKAAVMCNMEAHGGIGGCAVKA
jgi:hypothetical protein